MPKRKRGADDFPTEIYQLILVYTSKCRNILRLRFVNKFFNSLILDMFKPQVGWSPQRPDNFFSVEVVHWHEEGVYHDDGRLPLHPTVFPRARVEADGAFLTSSREHGFFRGVIKSNFGLFKCTEIATRTRLESLGISNIFVVEDDLRVVLGGCAINCNPEGRNSLDFGFGVITNGGYFMDSPIRQMFEPSTFCFDGSLKGEGRAIVFRNFSGKIVYQRKYEDRILMKLYDLVGVNAVSLLTENIFAAVCSTENNDGQQLNYVNVGEEIVTFTTVLQSVALYKNFFIYFLPEDKTVRIGMLYVENDEVRLINGRTIWRCRRNMTVDRPYLTLSNHGFTIDLSNKRKICHFFRPLIQ